MDRSEYLVVIENGLERSLRKSLYEALKWIEDLPADTNIECSKKISAYVELLSFILSFSESLGSMQRLVLASMKKRNVLLKRPRFEKATGAAGLGRKDIL